MTILGNVFNKVDGNNSSTNAISSGSSFNNSTYTDITKYGGVTVSVYATAVTTVTGTLQMNFSHDGVTVHNRTEITVDDARKIGHLLKIPM